MERCLVQGPAKWALLGGMAFLLNAMPAHAAGDRALGEYLAAECSSCHQLSGRSIGSIPSITGWPEEQFIAVLDSYGRKQHGGQVMQAIAARLSREDMAALAAYFSALAARP
jgi:cytochrome c553